MERVLGVRQVRIIGGLLSPRALPRTLSSSREPARASRGRREFPAAAPPVVSARCNQTLKLVAVKVQQGAAGQPLAGARAGKGESCIICSHP